MNGADAFRWVVLLLDAFAFGTILAVWERVIRFVLPKAAVRLFLAASFMFLVDVAIEVVSRFGEPFRWRTGFAALTLLLYIAGLVRLYAWFGTELGRRRRHELINEFAAHELHQLANLALALESDPEHIGRYVSPGWIGRALDLLGLETHDRPVDDASSR